MRWPLVLIIAALFATTIGAGTHNIPLAAVGLSAWLFGFFALSIESRKP